MLGPPRPLHQVQPAVRPEEADSAAPQWRQAGGGHVLVPLLLCLPSQSGLRDPSLPCQNTCNIIAVISYRLEEG